MNNTSIDTDSDEALLSRTEGITWCAVFIVEAFVTFIGNALTIAVFLRSKHFRRKKFCLLMNLAVADLLVGGVAIPLDVYTWLPHNFDLWGPVDSDLDFQSAAVFCLLLATFASVTNLTMISLERFYATLYPFRHRLLKTQIYVVLVFLIWTITAVPFIMSFIYSYGLISSDVFLYFRSLFATSLLLTICVTYIGIWIKIKWGTRPQQHRVNKRDYKLTVTLFIVTVLSLLAWLPMQVMSIVLSADTSFVWPTWSTLLRIELSLKLLLFGNSLVNPILYSMRMPKFKEELASIYSSVAGRKSTRRRNEQYEMTERRRSKRSDFKMLGSQDRSGVL